MTTLAFTFSVSWLADVAVTILLYAVLAVSLNLITGFAGMFSLGHHGLFAVGAYATAWLSTRVGHVEAGSLGALGLFFGSAVFSVAAASAAGLLIGVPCLRLRGDYLAIATLAFAQIVQIVIERTEALGGSLGLPGAKWVLDQEGRVTTFRLLFIGIGVVLLTGTVLVVRNLMRSAHGRSIVSVREDETASDLLGVRVTQAKIRAFVLGSGLAGLAGWFLANFNETVGVGNFDLMVGIKILLIVVLGGLGSISGSVVAAALLVGLERLLMTGIFGKTLERLVPIEYALALILLMLLRPNGLFGSREIGDVVRDLRARRGRAP